MNNYSLFTFWHSCVTVRALFFQIQGIFHYFRAFKTETLHIYSLTGQILKQLSPLVSVTSVRYLPPLRGIIVNNTIPYYTILYYTILYYTILYYTILYYTILYYTILYYTILYYTILYYTILYYTILEMKLQIISRLHACKYFSISKFLIE